MRKVSTSSVTRKRLVERFAAISLEQDKALLRDEIAKFNRLFKQLMKVERELKARVSDQRDALLDLFDNPNAQVRLNAAKATLAVAPSAARQLLQSIADSKEYPQAGDAGMCLWNLDRGVFKPT